MHNSHDPRGPVNRLVLKNGEMTYLGAVRDFGDRQPEYEYYYALPSLAGTPPRYLKMIVPFHYEERAEIVSELPNDLSDDPDHQNNPRPVRVPREKRPVRPLCERPVRPPRPCTPRPE